MIRLGVISYLNTRPLVYALEQNLFPHRFELVYDVPSVCARRLSTGDLDLGIIPVVEYARTPGYRIVPGVAIAAHGPVKSVLILSQKPLDQVRSLALDTSSRTSVALARILLHRRHGFSGPCLDHPPDLDAMLRKADAAVLIGDLALHARRPDLYVYDLGQLWLEETGLPFVFAVWTGPADLRPEDVAALSRAKKAGMDHVPDIALAYSKDNPESASFYADYLTRNVRYDLGEKEIEGMKTFFRYAADLGLIERTPDIRLHA